MSVTEDLLQCPLTYQLFQDPVLAQDGHTYERQAIEQWIRIHGTSPLTRQPLSIEHIYPNHMVRKLIDNFEKTSNEKNYQFILNTDVKRKSGRPLFQTTGKTIYGAEWLPNKKNRPEIVLLKIAGAQPNREASFYVKLTCHSHIVRTFGIVKDSCENEDEKSILLLQEYAPEGSLFELLQDRPNPPAENILIQIFLQIIEGMIFLASNRIVHGDLACRNVLVFRFNEDEPEKTVVKITDFGLSRYSRLYSRTSISAGSVLNIVPILYAAPEVIAPDATSKNMTEKSDIYSMAVLMWEAYSRGAVPWGKIEHQSEIIQRVRNGEVLKRPNNCSLAYWSIMLKAWSLNPDDRPTFVELKQMLNVEYYKSDDNRMFGNLMSQRFYRYENPTLQKQLRSTDFLQHKWTDDGILKDEDMIIIVQELIENSNEKKICLNLGCKEISDEAVKLLSFALKKNPISSIKTLILERTGLTDLGVRYLAEMLKVNTTLVELELNSAGLTDQGVRFLVDALLDKNRTLIVLSLLGNYSVTDASVERLCRLMKKHQTLKELGVYGCSISYEGLQQLRSVAKQSEISLRGWRY